VQVDDILYHRGEPGLEDSNGVQPDPINNDHFNCDRPCQDVLHRLRCKPAPPRYSRHGDHGTVLLQDSAQRAKILRLR